MENKITINAPKMDSSLLEEGQFFYNHRTDTAYILSRCGYGKFALINLKEGGRWAIDVESSPLDAFAGKFKEFVRITESFTITPDNN